MDKPILRNKDLTMFEFEPLSRIIKNKAEPRLNKMQTKIIGIRIFILQLSLELNT